jgi:peptidyl-tRNA hydrolase, PTH1 family
LASPDGAADPPSVSSSTQIKLVAGLGNPGAEYAATRHNVGFMLVDQLAESARSIWERSTKWDALTTKLGDVILAKPQSFMNRSGQPLHAIAQFYKIAPEEMLIVLDDFALPLGRIRIRPDGGTGGHNGLESIIVQFGTDKIPRLRIGIGAAPERGSTDYVLGRFFEEEQPVVRSTIERAAAAVKEAIDNGLVSAMNKFNKIDIEE